MLYLPEETPCTPLTRGSIKPHKEGNPVRLITNETGGAPLPISQETCSASLYAISGCHLSNTTDMMAKLQNVGKRCRIFIIFDVKSLFTNVPIVRAITAATRTLVKTDEGELSLPIDDYIKLTRLCVGFEFRGREYEQVQRHDVLTAFSSPCPSVHGNP